MNPKIKFKTILINESQLLLKALYLEATLTLAKVCSKTLLDSSTLRRFLAAIRSYMLNIPNSTKGNCLTKKENHTLCLKSDIKSIICELPKYNSEKQSRLRLLIYGFWRNAHDQYTNPLARPLLIALQVENIVWIAPLPLLVFVLFYFVFEDNFLSTSPCGAYLEGRFNGGFFALPAWEAYIWRGLFPEFYGILKEISENDSEFERSFCSQVRLRRKLYLEKEKLEIVLICMNCKR